MLFIKNNNNNNKGSKKVHLFNGEVEFMSRARNILQDFNLTCSVYGNQDT